MPKLPRIFGALLAFATLLLAQSSETGQTYTFPGGVSAQSEASNLALGHIVDIQDFGAKPSGFIADEASVKVGNALAGCGFDYGTIRFTTGPAGVGNYLISYIQSWNAWMPSHYYAVFGTSPGSYIVDTNGNLQQVTAGGTSGTTPPPWSTMFGGTTSDGGMGGVTWTNRSSTPFAPAGGSPPTCYLLIDKGVAWPANLPAPDAAHFIVDLNQAPVNPAVPTPGAISLQDALGNSMVVGDFQYGPSAPAFGISLGAAPSGASALTAMYQGQDAPLGAVNATGGSVVERVGRGTGSATGGTFSWTVCPAGSTGTVYNTCNTSMTLSAAGNLTVPGNLTAPSLTDTGTTQYGVLYGGGASTPIQSLTPATAGQVLTAGGSSAAPTYVEFFNQLEYPPATCNSGGTAIALFAVTFTSPATALPMPYCRSATNVQAGYIQFNAPNQFAWLQSAAPSDWDTTTGPFVKINFTQNTNHPGDTIDYQVAVACGATDNAPLGSTHSFGAVTTVGVAGRQFAAGYQLTTADLMNCTKGGMMNVQISTASDQTATSNLQMVTITWPRLLGT